MGDVRVENGLKEPITNSGWSNFHFTLSEFLRKIKYPSLLPVAISKIVELLYNSWERERKDGFMPFRRVFAWIEMQTSLSRIWTKPLHPTWFLIN